jgi:hypothetical protein
MSDPDRQQKTAVRVAWITGTLGICAAIAGGTYFLPRILGPIFGMPETINEDAIRTQAAAEVLTAVAEQGGVGEQSIPQLAPTTAVPAPTTIPPTSQAVAPTALPQQPRALREERVELGPYEYDTYTITLADDGAIVGDAVDVEDRGLHCVVFWARGPRTITFSMLNGAWDRYSGVTTQAQLDELVQGRYNYLQYQHWYCKGVDVPIIELGS